MKRTIFLFIVLFAITSISYSQTNYYISSSEGNDSNSGTSPGTAWENLTRVDASWGTFNAGDSILFKRGDEWAPVTSTYLLRTPNDYGGTDGSYIVMGAYGSGSKPILSTVNGAGYGLRADGLHWFIVQDIEFRGALSVRGHANGTYNIKFLRITMDGNVEGTDIPAHLFIQGEEAATATVGVNIMTEPVYDVEVGYCEFYDAWDAGFQSADALNLNATVGNIWVHHNTFVNTRNREAIDIGGGDNVTIEYNKVYGGTPGFSGFKIHAQRNTLDSLIIRGNELIVPSNTIGITVYGASNSWIYNNTISHTTPTAYAGMYIGSHSGGTPMQCSDFVNTVVANNVVNGYIGLIHANSNDGTGFTVQQVLNGYTWTKHFQEDPLYITNYFYNNQFFNENADRRIMIRREYGVGNITITDQEFEESDLSLWLSNNNVSDDAFSDPQFINGNYISPTNPGNYIPQAGSPILQNGYIIADYLFDINGNPIPVGVPPDRGSYQISFVPIDLGIQLFLQGAYISGTMNTDLNTAQVIPLNQPYNLSPWNYNGSETVSNIPSGVVDWVILELRSNPTTTISRKAAFILSNGDIVDLDGSSSVHFSGVADGDYYLVADHRNHLSLMSSNPISLTNNILNYDFTTALNNAYGTNAMVELEPGVYGMFSGDGDANGIINNDDFNTVAPNIFQTGYKAGDIDLNSVVNVLDYGKINPNLNKSTQVPNN